MKATSAMIALLVALAPVAGVSAAVAGAVDAPMGSQTGVSGIGGTGAATSQADNASNASLGASISSFMQASEADANSSVNNGMFEAAFEQSNGTDRAELVQKRVETLEKRLDRLSQERQELVGNTEDGGLSVAERAKVARLTARIEGLQQAINQTEAAADRAGVNLQQLNEIRQQARNMSGPPQVATGLDDIDRRRGPPENPGQGVGPDSDRPPGEQANRTDTGNESGPGNSGDGGPGNGGPGDAGNADNRSQGNGQGDGGPGNDNPGNGSDGNSGNDGQKDKDGTESNASDGNGNDEGGDGRPQFER